MVRVAGVATADVSHFSGFGVWHMKRPPRKLAITIFQQFEMRREQQCRQQLSAVSAQLVAVHNFGEYKALRSCEILRSGALRTTVSERIQFYTE
jgi:hypothetical protein